MKKLFMFFAVAFAAVLLTACPGKKQEPDGPQGPDVVEEGRPEVEPVEGAFVIVAQFEQAPCNDVVFVGQYTHEDGTTVQSWDGAVAAKFKLVEGYKTWYQLVIKPFTDPIGADNITNPVGDVLAKGKAVQLKEDGSFAWENQWARNSVEVLDGAVMVGDENGGEQFLAFSAETSKVVYVKSSSWAMNPCAAAIPGGNHEWKVVLSDTCQAVPEDAKVIFTGNFAEKSWGESDRVMTRVDANTFTWTGEYPENFQAKAICVTADEKQHWMNGGNVVFDGSNYTIEVPSWGDWDVVAE